MKTHKMFSTISILIIMVSSNINFTAFAQPNPELLQAERDAILDAERDVNKPLWFGTGCLLSGLVFVPLPGLYTSCLLTISGVAGTYLYQPAPPTNRFIGKSSEYISVYTSIYKSKRGKIQTNMASAGCIGGCLGIGGTLLVIGFSLLDENQIISE